MKYQRCITKRIVANLRILLLLKHSRAAPSGYEHNITGRSYNTNRDHNHANDVQDHNSQPFHTSAQNPNQKWIDSSGYSNEYWVSQPGNIEPLVENASSYQEPLFTMDDVLKWHAEEQGMTEYLLDQPPSPSPSNLGHNLAQMGFGENFTPNHALSNSRQKYWLGGESDSFTSLEANSLDGSTSSDVITDESVPQISPSLESKGEYKKHHLAPWKKELKGYITKAYEAYGSLNNCGKGTATKHIDAVQDARLTWQLLDADPDKRIKAALEIKYRASKVMNINERPRPNPKGNPRIILGEYYEKALRALEKATNRCEDRARKTLKENLTTEMINLIVNPETFEEAIQMIAESHRQKSENLVRFDPSLYVVESSDIKPGATWTVSGIRTSKGQDEEDAEDANLLGSHYRDVSRVFRKVTLRGHGVASRHIKANITPELAREIKDPTTRAQGMKKLIKSYGNSLRKIDSDKDFMY